MIAQASTLSRAVKWRVFWRSLFIQAGFNPKNMQGLGMLYALYPALKKLYPDPNELQKAVQRHLETFNTHPYVASAIVGGSLYYEERIARGESKPEAVSDFKRALMGPLAAIGDGFFWLSLRPAVGALGVALTPIFSMWAAVVILGIYNTIHFAFRVKLFWAGANFGSQLLQELQTLKLRMAGKHLQHFTAACLGGFAAWLSLHSGYTLGGHGAPLVLLGALGLGLTSLVALRQGAGRYLVWYAGVLVAFGLGYFL